jgi:hypothetical protein
MSHGDAEAAEDDQYDDDEDDPAECAHDVLLLIWVLLLV